MQQNRFIRFQALFLSCSQCGERRTNKRTDRRITNGRTKERTDERTDGRTNGRTNGRTDGLVENIIPPASLDWRRCKKTDGCGFDF